MAYFIKLIIYCLIDLIPFVLCYLTFTLFFALCYISLEVEIDSELDSAVGLGYFGRMFLVVWRNSVSKLSFPLYSAVMLTERDGAMRDSHIILIYMVYFMQIMWMFCMMLNFMIAVIEETYLNVDKVKTFHIYKNMAELNKDCYELIEYFTTLE